MKAARRNGMLTNASIDHRYCDILRDGRTGTSSAHYSGNTMMAHKPFHLMDRQNFC
jgi:hypothetical protein